MTGMNATTPADFTFATEPTHPLPHVRVSDALDAYLEANGFRIEDYDAPTFTLQFLGRDWTFKNRPNRARAIPLHDLHHVATGYATNLVGEGEIGAWELGAGCETFIVYALNGMAAFVGCFLSPRRMLAAWKAGRRGRTLYRAKLGYADAKGMTVGELRRALGVPEGGLAPHV